MIDEAAIRKRMAELSEMMEKHISNANACKGALQDCEYWLSVLVKEPQKPE